MPSKLKTATLSFCAASCLFLWVPLYSVYLSLNDVNFSIRDFFTISLTITLICSILFYTISITLPNVKLKWLASGILYTIIFWSSVSGLIFPLSAPAGMSSPEELPINFLNLALTAAIALPLTLLTFTKLKPATQIFAAVLIVSSLSTALPALYSTGSSASRFSSLSKDDNVIVLSFDGLAGVIAKQIIDENPVLKDKFRDFVFFDNVISLAPATIASLRSELYGNINFREIGNNSKNIQDNLTNRTNSISREQSQFSDVMTYGMYSSFNQVPSDIIFPGTILGSNLD